ncbi:MAG TPA: hypothetical protein VMB51_01625 [Solirubrobacteraceae bacterium]|nr:hypothetical protein [Solirubrobacteraceae bacterium]
MLLALGGMVYQLGLIRYFARLHRARLSHFTDPMTGELQIPGGRLPLPRTLRRAPWVFVFAEIAVLMVLPARANSVPRPPGQMTATIQPQRPGTCQIAPPQVRFATGEWTATETILTTNAIDACAGERLVRPWDFRRVCNAESCKTSLYTASYYGTLAATIVPDGGNRYVATFPPSTTPCPHRPGEDIRANREYKTLTLWWSSHRQILHGLSRAYQVGPCGGGQGETSSYVVTRTSPAANPPAEGP